MKGLDQMHPRSNTVKSRGQLNYWHVAFKHKGPSINYVIADREGGVWPKDYNIT